MKNYILDVVLISLGLKNKLISDWQVEKDVAEYVKEIMISWDFFLNTIY